MKIKNWFILAGGSATRWQAEPEDIDPNWNKVLEGEL